MQIEGIQLHREGPENGPAFVVVEIQVNGEFIEIAREPVDANFCHHVSEAGVAKAIRDHEYALYGHHRKKPEFNDPPPTMPHNFPDGKPILLKIPPDISEDDLFNQLLKRMIARRGLGTCDVEAGPEQPPMNLDLSAGFGDCS